MRPSRERIIQHLIPAVEDLLQGAHALAEKQQQMLAQIPPTFEESARNLLHYLSLRQHDIRQLQKELAELGLSRLGRAESQTLGSLEAVLHALYALAGKSHHEHAAGADGMSHGKRLLAEHATALFGPEPAGFPTRIMVTMPSEAAIDPQLVHDLLAAGMQVMRINCAHDDLPAWLAMIEHLRRAEQRLGRSCKVYADLAGPKLRTGAIQSPGRLLEFKVRRDIWGSELSPAWIWLAPAEHVAEPDMEVDAVLPLGAGLLQHMQSGDRLEVDDVRGTTRSLHLHERRAGAWLATCHHHGYIGEAARCRLYRQEELIAEGPVGELPELTQPLRLFRGDLIHLLPSHQIGRPAEYDAHGRCIRPASIPCSLDAVFDAARTGQPVWFDDGKIGGRIDSVTAEYVQIEITHASPQGSKLWPEKGINLPETELAIPALTDEDIEHLHGLARHIDMVGMSFVRNAEEVRMLHRQIQKAKAGHLGCVIKIETRQAFHDLPHILLAGMQQAPFGIMLARGDLAVEIGFERLSEVQEEVLCLCEAAHVPVIWATQVLETMAKKGIPSRAEVSDAALSIRAECVMLNKGDYIVPTVEFLHGVLQRMSGHHDKQRPTLRRLAVSDFE